MPPQHSPRPISSACSPRSGRKRRRGAATDQPVRDPGKRDMGSKSRSLCSSTGLFRPRGGYRGGVQFRSHSIAFASSAKGGRALDIRLRRRCIADRGFRSRRDQKNREKRQGEPDPHRVPAPTSPSRAASSEAAGSGLFPASRSSFAKIESGGVGGTDGKELQKLLM